MSLNPFTNKMGMNPMFDRRNILLKNIVKFFIIGVFLFMMYIFIAGGSMIGGIGVNQTVTLEDGTVIENCIVQESYEGFHYTLTWEENGSSKTRKVAVEYVISLEKTQD